MKRLADWWFEPAPARRLGMIRLLTVLFVGVYLAVQGPEFVGLGTKESTFRPVGPGHLLPGKIPAALWYAVLASLAASGTAFAVGWRGRVTGPIFAALLLLVTTYRSCFGMIFHADNLLMFHVIVLACCRSSEAYAVGVGRGPERSDEAYGWPIKLLSAVTLAAYFVAGVAKLKVSGLGWIGDDTLMHHIAFDNLRKAELGVTWSPFTGIAFAAPALFVPLAVLTLVLEVGAPLVLLNRKLGQVWAVAAWAFHLGIALVMWITFMYPLLGFAYLSFFDVEKLDRRSG